MKKKVFVSVINDLVSDQRVRRSCHLLQRMGFEVVLVGRELPESAPLTDEPYEQVRLRLSRNKGPAFYAEFQIKLFNYLQKQKFDVLFANDLDTLLPNHILSVSRKLPLIYDAHELFTEVPELAESALKRKAWQMLEKFIVPDVRHMITVNQSIADEYTARYGVKPLIVRNIPEYSFTGLADKQQLRKDLSLPPDKTILILQGAGININRGAEEAIEAMQHIPNALLLIIGSGDVFPLLPQLVNRFKVQDKVQIHHRMPYRELIQFTQSADWGLSLDKDTGLNYRFSLPNKLFDYLNSGTPAIASNLPEINRIVSRYGTGKLINRVDALSIAETVNQCAVNSEEYLKMKENCGLAAIELNWAKESKILENLFSKFI
jgi:glycosyltransferase involved in cell wall biosynthesis